MMKKLRIVAAAVLWVGLGINMAHWRMDVRHVECLEYSLSPQMCHEMSTLMQASYYLEGLILGPPAFVILTVGAALTNLVSIVFPQWS